MNRLIAAGVAVGVVLLVFVAVLAGMRRHARSVPTLTVSYAPFLIQLPESGVVQYPQIQTISAQVSGSVGRIYVRPGQRVRRGELLATIENPQIGANAASTEAAYRSAAAHAAGAQVTGGSNVVQAQANLETARMRLAQAQQDLANGLQPGLGYGETTAAEQRAEVDANLATATTNLREARRTYLAYGELYGEKAVSREQLDEAQAKYEEARGAYQRARLAQASLGSQLARSHDVLVDNLQSAREGYAQAQSALEAARVESGSGDVAAAQAEAARAQAEYAFARFQASATRVAAPYDATVLTVASEKDDPLRPLQPGDAVDAGEPIVTLAAQRRFVVRTRIDEQDVIDVALGERVRITGEDFPGKVLSGRVVELSPMAQRAPGVASGPRTVAATIAIDRPPAFLRDGMSADVAILTTDIPRAIVLPGDAIRHDESSAYVYVVRDGAARREPVKLGASNENGSMIEAGLQPGDVVIVGSADGLNDGTPVAPATVTPR